MNAKIKGCYPAIVTPFEVKGLRYEHAINYYGIKKLLQHLLIPGIGGVVVAGCTGSASVLDHDEQVDIVNSVKKYVDRNFEDKLVIAGDGSNNTKEAIELSKRMEEIGVFTHLSISPYYNKPSDIGIIEHYSAIAENIEGELILYSVPSRTGGKGILPDVANELANNERIIGIKEASGDIERIKETIEKTKDKGFFVISGDDSLTYKIIQNGGVGAISVAANVAPKDVSSMIEHALLGHVDIAENLDKKLQVLYNALFPKDEGNASPNPVMCHYALNRLGIPVGVPRLPLTPGEYHEKKRVDEALESLGLKTYF